MSRPIIPTKPAGNDTSITDVSIGEIQDFRKMLTRRTSVIMAEDGKKTKKTFILFDKSNNNGLRDMDELHEDNSSWNESQSLLPTPYNLSPSNNVFMNMYQTYKAQLLGISQNPTLKAVVKCSLTYFIASLAVYCVPIANLLGKSDSKHVVCTTCVYFHSARTKGSMLRSTMYVVISISYAFIVSICCMFAASFFYNENDFFISACVDLIGSSVALGLISFAKQKVNTADFNVACSLSAIAVISVVVKEGSLNANNIPFQKIHSIFMIVSLGVLISVLMCYFVWPTNAIDDLNKNLDESSKLLSHMLVLVPDKFLNGENIQSPEFVSLDQKLKQNLAALGKSLDEAKYEFYVAGDEKKYLKFVKLVECTNKLARNLAGLRTSAEMEWALLNEQDSGDTATLKSQLSYRLLQSSGTHTSEPIDGSGSASPLDEDSEDEEADENIVAMNSTELFQLFVYHLGPSLKSFSLTMKQILVGLKFSGSKFNNSVMYERSLKLASELFDRNHTKAVNKLYNQEIFNVDSDIETRVHQEEVAAACGNFSSLLSQFSKELTVYLQILQDTTNAPKTYDWLRFWERREEAKQTSEFSLSNALTKYNGLKNNAAASKSLNYRIWNSLKVFRRVDVQFGIRVGIGAFFISSFAFWNRTRDIFIDWKGEWILVTFCIVMNKSLGGTNMTVSFRFLGTFLGAVSAFMVWKLFEGDVIALALAGFLISIPSFHIILNWSDVNAFGRFILLTYNLTALYSYSMTQHDDEDGSEGGDLPIIQEIAFHRFIGVTVGASFAVLMTLVFLPNSARSRLRKGLSVLWLRMGIVWNSDPLSYTYDPVTTENLLDGIKDTSLSSIMNELGLLLKQSPKEPRLKGAFPKETYSKILACTGKIHDSFENMNTMIEVDRMLSINEERVITYTKVEREELSSRVFLIFYMISSAMALGFPIPTKPASIEHSKDRMLAKLNEIRSYEILKNEDVVLLYSYILVTSTIAEELDKLIDLVGDLFGLVNEETFEL